MTLERLSEELARRAAGNWELYRKQAESRELEASADLRRNASRREEGWAARWWEGGAPRFAAASSPEELADALPVAARLALSPETPPAWPSQTAASASPPASDEPPPDLFEEVAHGVAAASRGEAFLGELSLRRGTAHERIVNGAGLDVAQTRRALGGVAWAIGKRGAIAREVRLPFQWDEGPRIEALVRRLSDAATLPLADPRAPFSSGQWLLDPSVAGALLAAIAPAFCAERPPLWITRGRTAAPGVTIVDDASPDAPFDGEGSPTRRVVLVAEGSLVGRLEDLRSAARSGGQSTGHGVRPSYRTPPSVAPRRLFFGTGQPSSPSELLSGVTRGAFASALTAPVRVHLADDRYEVEFTGVAVAGGRALGPIPAARSRGRISELLRRIVRLSNDLQFSPMPFLVGSPTILIERASFE